MNTKSKNLPLLPITVGVIILNAILFYMLCCSNGVLHSRDVFRTEYSYTTEEIALQTNIIKGLPTDMQEAQSLLETQYQQLQESSNISLSRTPEETDTAIKLSRNAYKAVLSKVNYLLGYSDYATGISDNAAELSQLPIYSQNSWALNNIIKTQKDFYGLEHVTLSLVPEAGYMTLLNYRVTDILALLLTLASIWLLAPSKDFSANRRIAAPVLLWQAGLLAMYLCNIALTASSSGLPDFNTAIQSLSPFQRCPYLISCGALLVVDFSFKLAGFAVLLCMGLLLLSGQKKLHKALPVGFIAIELLLALSDDIGSIPELLREVNLFSAFGAERFFLRYLNLNILEQAVSALPLFVLFMLLLTAGTIFLAGRQVSTYTRELMAQTERDYYDEIDRRHEESRKIRHDINNHLLALNLLIEKGDLTGAQTYLGEISEKLDQTIMPVRTGSNVLDALLWQKLRQAQALGIELQTDIQCSVSGRNISDYDLCGIFGNLLDNALEAAKDAGHPTIKLFISNQLNMLYISCENPYTGELKRWGDRLFTTKADAGNHGFGIARIREIAKLYDGDVNISTENGRFLIEVLLNNK